MSTMRNARASFLFAPLFAFGALTIACAPAAAADNPVVIELFTSQGCSSCPPADKLLAKLAREPNVIALSFPVDYWDYIGWKDTFGSAAHTARQKAYAAARGDNHVYTPQAVIDGLMHAVGSDSTEIAAARQLAYGEKGALQVPLKLGEDGAKLHIEAGAAVPGSARSGALWLLNIKTVSTVAIGKGENSGHSITYTNIVRGMKKIGDWSGAAATYEIARPEMKSGDSDAYVILLQANAAGKPGVILAAAKGGAQ